jgi:hypothetical protein
VNLEGIWARATNNLFHFPNPCLITWAGVFYLYVDLGNKGETVVWLEYGIVSIRIGWAVD